MISDGALRCEKSVNVYRFDEGMYLSRCGYGCLCALPVHVVCF